MSPSTSTTLYPWGAVDEGIGLAAGFGTGCANAAEQTVSNAAAAIEQDTARGLDMMFLMD
jgi:hypothetical protein